MGPSTDWIRGWVGPIDGLEALKKKTLSRLAENRTVIPRLLDTLQASALDGSEELASGYSTSYSVQTAYSAQRQKPQQSFEDVRS